MWQANDGLTLELVFGTAGFHERQVADDVLQRHANRVHVDVAARLPQGLQVHWEGKAKRPSSFLILVRPHIE